MIEDDTHYMLIRRMRMAMTADLFYYNAIPTCTFMYHLCPTGHASDCLSNTDGHHQMIAV